MPQFNFTGGEKVTVHEDPRKPINGTFVKYVLSEGKPHGKCIIRLPDGRTQTVDESVVTPEIIPING
jgi:hypothetical protein